MHKYIRILLLILALTFISYSNLLASSKATVSYKYVNLRAMPSEDAQIITELVRGVPVALLAERKDWYKIESEQEIIGWVVKRSLKVVLPVTFKKTPLPKPTPAAMEQPSAKTPPKEQKGLLTYNEKVKAQKKSYEDKTKDKKSPSKKVAAAGNESGTSEPVAITKEGYLDRADTEMPEFPSFTATFIRMISSLFIIVGLILLLYYVVKKYFSKSILSLEGASAITILASKHISHKTMLYVVDVLEKIIIIGVVGSEMKLLTEISDKAAIERMRKEISSIKESERPFKKFFSEKVKSAPASYTGQKEESFDILDEINEKIEKKVDGLRDRNDR